MTLDQALAAGLDAFEAVADFATTAKGYSVEADGGHVTIVIDRATRQLVGAAMAVPDASAAIHECVLAIKARVPIDVLADTIHAFPSTSRILNGLFAEAAVAGRDAYPLVVPWSGAGLTLRPSPRLPRQLAHGGRSRAVPRRAGTGRATRRAHRASSPAPMPVAPPGRTRPRPRRSCRAFR